MTHSADPVAAPHLQMSSSSATSWVSAPGSWSTLTPPPCPLPADELIISDLRGVGSWVLEQQKKIRDQSYDLLSTASSIEEGSQNSSMASLVALAGASGSNSEGSGVAALYKQWHPSVSILFAVGGCLLLLLVVVWPCTSSGT